MTEIVPAEAIEEIVGVRRHHQVHIGRPVSAEETFYILHSTECLATFNDPRECMFSHALDNGIDDEEWTEDEPHWLIIDAGRLAHEGLVIQCRECGCTELLACTPPCSWVEPDLCSACTGPASRA